MSKATWTDPFRLAPALPEGQDMDELRALATDVLDGSVALVARLAPETAQAIGDKLRILNSLYSNHIEGQTSTYRDIENGLNNQFSPVPAQRYAQELGAAHVKAERNVMRDVLAKPDMNVSNPQFIAEIHRRFFFYLPPEHQYTHEGGHFTDIHVLPGTFREKPIGIRGSWGTTQIGPKSKPELEANMEAFGKIFDPVQFRGGEAKIIAAAAGHLKLAWLHPFRDGNGRTVRLYSGCFMARCGINRANLWSLSRGMAIHRDTYMSSLFTGDPQPLREDRGKIAFASENVIDFMRQQLKLQTVADRIDSFAAIDLEHFGKHKMDAGRLLRAVFAHGRLERKEAYEVLAGINPRSAQRIVGGLVSEGLLEAKDHKAPLTIGLPARAMQAYFPNLCTPSIMGGEA